GRGGSGFPCSACCPPRIRWPIRRRPPRSGRRCAARIGGSSASRVACTRCSTSFPPSGRGLSTSSATGSPSGSSAGRTAVSSHDPLSPGLRVGCAAMAPPVLPRELVYLALDDLEANETFRLREVGDVSSLAQSIAQLGQLFPVEVRLRGGKYQLITGFR